MVLCAAFMALGTGMGGRRIIDTVGRDMVSLGPREGFSADLAFLSAFAVSVNFPSAVCTQIFIRPLMFKGNIGIHFGQFLQYGVRC